MNSSVDKMKMVVLAMFFPFLVSVSTESRVLTIWNTTGLVQRGSGDQGIAVLDTLDFQNRGSNGKGSATDSRALLTASSKTVTLNLTQASVIEGAMSGQDLSVLNTLDLSGTADSWDRYKELTSPSNGRFIVDFKFLYTPSSRDQNLTDIFVFANSIGVPYRYQQRTFKMYDYINGHWDVLGNNGGCLDWVWFQQNFSRSTGDLRRYLNPQSEVIIRFTSNNAYDACDLDYLKVEFALTDTSSSSFTSSCAENSASCSNSTNSTKDWWKPRKDQGLTWQWQLQGTLNTSFEVDVYDIDLFDNSAAAIADLHQQGRKVICYFSAGSYEFYRDDWAKYFPFVTKGVFYTGNEPPFLGALGGYEGSERWLDVRRMDLLGPIMRARLELAAQKGCDAVEPDNVCAYENPTETGANISYADQLAYNKWLAKEAHSLGLSVGLKNSNDNQGQIYDLVDYFDWALNEQCYHFDECGSYESTFLAQGKAVFGAEYRRNGIQTYCQYFNSREMSWIWKNDLLFANPRIGCEIYSAR